jgi:hypothetical protein
LICGYYLTGGTALALHLAHRVSLDLDLFTVEPVERLSGFEIIRRCEGIFGTKNTNVIVSQVDQVWLDICGINVTFVAFPFRLKYPKITDNGVLIADIRDIALQKAYAMGRRASARDYVDLAFILQSKKVSLEDIITEAQEVFVIQGERVFSPRLFLQQLVYTHDLKDLEEALNLLRMPESFHGIARILEEAVKRATEGMLASERGAAVRQSARSARKWPFGFVRSPAGTVHLRVDPYGTRTLCGREFSGTTPITHLGARQAHFCLVCKRVAGVR